MFLCVMSSISRMSLCHLSLSLDVLRLMALCPMSYFLCLYVLYLYILSAGVITPGGGSHMFLIYRHFFAHLFKWSFFQRRKKEEEEEGETHISISLYLISCLSFCFRSGESKTDQGFNIERDCVQSLSTITQV